MAGVQPLEAGFIWRRTDTIGTSSETEILYFRKQFLYTDRMARCVLRISADSRYRLYINGELVLFGPCKGSEYRWYYETLDITEELQEGINQIAVKVLHYPITGENLSVSRSPYGMLICEAACYDEQDELLVSIGTDESWLCQKDASLSFRAGEYNTMFLGGTEQTCGELRPFGWETLDHDDSQWEHCCVYDLVDTTTGVLEPWQLTQREIPLLYEKGRSFQRIMRSRGTELPDTAFQAVIDTDDETGCTLAAGSCVTLDLDAGELTTGFPVFTFSGGAGTRVEILYAECYEHPPVVIPWERDKGLRDDAAAGELYGDLACYRIAGIGNAEHPEVYEPFWFKTFRFIRVRITVGAEPCTFSDMAYRETGYPLEVRADFHCSDPELNDVWDISVRTLQRCMHESYEDCPYYEQFQYTMDTHLQMLFTYQISGDDSLARKAIYDYHCSKLPQGLLQSRFPSIEPQIIPCFNIYWILMVYDHYLYFRDEQLLRRYLPTIDGVLYWFEGQLGEEGLVTDIPRQYWQFIDWVDQWREGRGVPPAAQEGPLTVTSLLYAVGLQRAAELHAVLGREGMAGEYRDRSDQLLCSIRRLCWSSEHELFRDGPSSSGFSQHAQLWAVLAGLVDEQSGAALMRRAINDPTLAQVSYSMAFFLLRALSAAGVYREQKDPWVKWRKMLAMHLTTWNEDPVTQRSDCHAWGAIPLYDFTAELLGVRPESITSDRILIAPQPCAVEELQGTVMTRGGTVHVHRRRAGGKTILTIKNPDALELVIRLPDGTCEHENRISITLDMEA